MSSLVLPKKVFCAEAGGLIDPNTIEKNSEFKKRFLEINNVPVKLYSPYVYDATMMLVQSMVDADSTNPNIYAKYLSDLTYNGVTGPISFDDFGDVKNASLTIFTFKNGQKFPLEIIKASTDS